VTGDHTCLRRGMVAINRETSVLYHILQRNWRIVSYITEKQTEGTSRREKQKRLAEERSRREKQKREAEETSRREKQKREAEDRPENLADSIIQHETHSVTVLRRSNRHHLQVLIIIINTSTQIEDNSISVCNIRG